jgi:hypothetical protein
MLLIAIPYYLVDMKMCESESYCSSIAICTPEVQKILPECGTLSRCSKTCDYFSIKQHIVSIGIFLIGVIAFTAEWYDQKYRGEVKKE